MKVTDGVGRWVGVLVVAPLLVHLSLWDRLTPFEKGALRVGVGLFVLYELFWIIEGKTCKCAVMGGGDGALDGALQANQEPTGNHRDGV